MIELGPARRAAALRALPFALIVIGVAAFDLGFHEFWRDEAGAIMVTRAVSWGELLTAMRYEGVPPLFHVLLKIADAILPNPLALVMMGALGLSVLLFGTFRLLASITQSRAAATALTLVLSFTYAYAYELGVVIRQYALGLGLALLSFACLRDALRNADRRAARLGAIAAGLSALASAHSACVAGGGLLAFVVVSIARRRGWRDLWPVLLALPSFALVAWLASPFPGRVAEGNVVKEHSNAIAATLSTQVLVAGVMPADWWFVESLVPRGFATAAATLRSLAFWGFVMGSISAIAARFASARPRRELAFDLLAVLASWPPLLLIFVHHYWGFYRHHLFLGLPLVVILFGYGLDREVQGPTFGFLRRLGIALLIPWLLFQTEIAIGSFALDARYPFSDTKSAARTLPANARVVTDEDWRSAGMIFWRPDIEMRSSSWSGRPFRYIRPDAEWHHVAPLPPIVVEDCDAAPDRVWFAGATSSLGPLAECASRVEFAREPLPNHTFGSYESFELHRVDCACVLRTAR